MKWLLVLETFLVGCCLLKSTQGLHCFNCIDHPPNEMDCTQQKKSLSIDCGAMDSCYVLQFSVMNFTGIKRFCGMSGNCKDIDSDIGMDNVSVEDCFACQENECNGQPAFYSCSLALFSLLSLAVLLFS